MRRTLFVALLSLGIAATVNSRPAGPAPLDQPVNTWLKRSPAPGGPVSPGMGYETSLGYDPVNRRVIRWGGHNQGGGGEQNAETWTFDPTTGKWELKEPNYLAADGVNYLAATKSGSGRALRLAKAMRSHPVRTPKLSGRRPART